jgi:hypothetical protein
MTVIHRLAQNELKGVMGTKEISEAISLVPSTIPTHYIWNNVSKSAITNMTTGVKLKVAFNKLNVNRIYT